jgi:hypothetical protein
MTEESTQYFVRIYIGGEYVDTKPHSDLQQARRTYDEAKKLDTVVIFKRIKTKIETIN